MRRSGLKAIALGALLAMAGQAPVLAADDAKAPNIPARLSMTDDGLILVTPSGMSLYTNGADDSTPGKSACSHVPVKDMRDPTSGLGRYPLPGHMFTKSCLEVWPPYLADAKAQPSGEWSVIDRPEGKQWAFRGRPLYLSVRDKKAGDRNGVMSGDGGGGGGRRGWSLAGPPLNYPPGMQIIREADTLVLATANGRPVYTPQGNRLRQASVGTEELFKPVAAPYVASLSGDWAAIEASAGRKQYAFKGKALYAAPDSLSDREIDAAGGWEKVVIRKLAGTPSDIDTRFTLIGDVYTDKNGKTLYLFSCTSPGCDEPGGPAAYRTALCGDAKQCSERWRPYVASANARPVGEWSVVEVADPIFSDPAGRTYGSDLPRVKAWAFRGRPLFTYYEDKQPGDVWGNQIRWFSMSSFQAVRVPGRGLQD